MGAGGSVLGLPVLVYIAGISPNLAVTYSLAIVGFGAFIGAINYYKKGLTDFKSGVVLAVPAMAGMYLTRAFVMPSIPTEIVVNASYSFSKDGLIISLFAVLMITASFFMLFVKQKESKVGKKTIKKDIVLAISGFFIGIITGFVGAGGGFVIIPALMFLAKIEIKKAVGTSLMIIAVNSLVGFSGDLVVGVNIDWAILVKFLAMVALGIFAGVRASKYIDSSKLKSIFGVFVLLVGTAVLVKSILQ
jgi:uncharacterized membrane protein YfcA